MADEPTDSGEPVSEDRIARARMRRSKAADEGDIAPKLPRGGGFKIGKGHFIKIALTASLLVMLIVIQRPCANAVSSFVTGFDGQGSDKAKMPKPGNVDSSPRYEPLNSTLTEAEWKAMVARQKGGSGSAGSGTPVGSATGSAGSGSAGSTP